MTASDPPPHHGKKPIVSAEGFTDSHDIFFAAVEMTRMPMIITDPNQADNPIVFANNAFIGMTGYSREEIEGRNCRFLQGPGTDRDTVAEVREAIEARRDVSVEILNYRKDGSAFWNALFVSPVFGPDGRLVYFFASQLDITRRKDAEDALRQAQKMEAVGQLTGGIAHDFNNMLTVVMGNVESALERVEDADVRKRLERAMEGARRAEVLTSQMLAFARKQRLDGRPASLNALVGQVQEMAGRTLGSQIEIRTDLDPDLHLANLDTVQAETALLNILINARDAMPEGGQLLIETCNLIVEEGHPSGAAPGRYVVLAVKDTGEGIAPEILARVTEPFFTTKEVGRGTGMGLAMVYGFMRQSQGVAHIESRPGQGTTVSLLFPAVDGGVEAEPAPRPEPTARGGDETVLMVEDNPDVAEMGAGILRDQGYTVVSAANAGEAMALIDQGQTFDLLFSDIVMPGGMNGVSLANAVRERRPRTPILLTTGWADRALEEDGQGVTYDLIGKPYRRADLVRKVRQLLDGPDGVS